MEFKTFRIKGHEEASGQEYIENSLIDQWAKKDPIKNYEKFLLKEKIISIGNATIRSPEYEILNVSRRDAKFYAEVLVKKLKKMIQIF